MTFQNHGAELDLKFEDGKLHQGIFESKNQITSDFILTSIKNIQIVLYDF